jgi:hypothetical protein
MVAPHLPALLNVRFAVSVVFVVPGERQAGTVRVSRERNRNVS